ncbi:hypothetical protein PoB_002243000, partial [Plakobranchus ocellatus]
MAAISKISFFVVSALLGFTVSKDEPKSKWMLSFSCWYAKVLPHCNFYCFPFRGKVYGCEKPGVKTCHGRDYKYRKGNSEYTCRTSSSSSWWERKCFGCDFGRSCYRVGSEAILHHTQCMCERKKCIDRGGSKELVHIAMGCFKDEKCHPVGSEVSTLKFAMCERKKCVNQNGYNKFVRVGW